MKMPSLWTILCYLFLTPKFIYRMKLIPWLFQFLGKALSGCKEAPPPRDLLERWIWYTRRIYAVYLLYRLLMDRYDKERV